MTTGPHSPWRDPVLVAGITPITTIDFPGRLAMVVFTQGCPWRCPYCHNASFRPLETEGRIPWAKVFEMIRARESFLDGIVFSGGEPTVHPGLPSALRDIRKLGFATGLHTAGLYPQSLAAALRELQWVGLDIKAPLDERYDKITGRSGSARRVLASLRVVLDSGIDFQLRTTVSPELTPAADLDDLRAQLRRLGAPEPVIQPAREVSASHVLLNSSIPKIR